MKRGKLAIIRSQARWIEDGEKPSKYFFRLAKQRIAERRSTALQNADGSVVHGIVLSWKIVLNIIKNVCFK